MARANKVGIDYFSHDVDMLADKKIKLLRAKYGLLGYAMYLRLLEEIYRDQGYYLQVDGNFNILFAYENRIEIDVYNNILNDCINYELFNINMYNDYNILTSVRIQENYCAATLRRKEVELVEEYLLLSQSKLDKIYGLKIRNVSINKINVNKNTQNADINKQSKVKESKVKNNNTIIVEQDSTECDSETSETSENSSTENDIPYEKIINYLNKKTNSKYKLGTKKTRSLIKARWNEGFRLDDFKKVITKKNEEWKNNPEMAKYLRPLTLFGPKFESYFNQKAIFGKGSHNFEQRDYEDEEIEEYLWNPEDGNGKGRGEDN